MIRRLSRVVLEPGIHREICLLERPDDRAVLLVATSRREGPARRRRRVRLTSFWFFAGELAPLLAALDEARLLAPGRIVTCGETRLPSGAVLVVGATRGAVRLQFRAPDDGRLLGQPTVLDGGEIGALERGAAHLASLPPAQRLDAAHARLATLAAPENA